MKKLTPEQILAAAKKKGNALYLISSIDYEGDDIFALVYSHTNRKTGHLIFKFKEKYVNAYIKDGKIHLEAPKYTLPNTDYPYDVFVGLDMEFVSVVS